MNEPEADGREPSSNDAPLQPPVTGGEQRRLGNPTRLMPRRNPPPEAASESVGSESFGDGAEREYAEQPMAARPANSMFAPRSFANGRIQVWGLAPGCLIASLIASVVLTLLLNIVF